MQTDNQVKPDARTECDSTGSSPARCYAAVWTVHTPSGPTDACEAHADKIQRLMSFLGAYTNKTHAPEGAECANCLNEAKRHNAKLCRPADSEAGAQGKESNEK